MFRALLWGCCGGALVLLLVGSLLPGGIPLLELPLSPPVKHVIAYAVLGSLLVLATEAGWPRAISIAVSLGALALLVELIQIPIPVRSFLWLDVGASTAGAVLGCVVGLGLRWIGSAIRGSESGRSA